MTSRRFNEMHGAALLATLGQMKGAPFETLCAEIAGYPPQTVNDWIRRGLEISRTEEGFDDPLAAFAREFRRHQALWMDQKTAELSKLEATREEANALNNLKWVLERMRRDAFDLSRAPKEAPKGESNLPGHKRPAAPTPAAKFDDELGRPEDGLQ